MYTNRKAEGGAGWQHDFVGEILFLSPNQIGKRWRGIIEMAWAALV